MLDDLILHTHFMNLFELLMPTHEIPEDVPVLRERLEVSRQQKGRVEEAVLQGLDVVVKIFLKEGKDLLLDFIQRLPKLELILSSIEILLGHQARHCAERLVHSDGLVSGPLPVIRELLLRLIMP